MNLKKLTMLYCVNENRLDSTQALSVLIDINQSCLPKGAALFLSITW